MTRTYAWIVVLLLASAGFASGQTTGSVADLDDVNTLGLGIRGMINCNLSCDKDKLGCEVGLDAEWRCLPRVGVGIGAAFSSESVRYEWSQSPTRDVLMSSKNDKKVSLFNIPLRVYIHPTDRLTFDVGLQWGYVVKDGSIKGMRNTCWSLPFGLSFGDKYRFMLRYQPYLIGMMRSGESSKLYSDLLLLGFGIIL